MTLADTAIAGSGGALEETGHGGISFVDLIGYSENILPTQVEVARLPPPPPNPNADYITAHKVENHLVIDLWRLGPIYRTDNY